MSKKTVSDKIAKIRCSEYLTVLGYTNIRAAKQGESCDLVAKLNEQVYFIEIKYSSLKQGKFFGTVMLTEMQKSIKEEKNFLFLVCRGDENIEFENWLFKIFTPQEFWRHCTLTTPIFHYHLYLDETGNINKTINHKPDAVKANLDLIETMWNDFQKWKNKQ